MTGAAKDVDSTRATETEFRHSDRNGRFHRRRAPWRRRLFGLVVAYGVAHVGGAVALDRHGDRDITTGRYDAIIVLGCRVMPDGHASTSLARRARHGALLWHRGLAPRLVLTGGIGDYPPSEASVAMDLIRAQGVPEDRIALEERSTSTDENLRFAAENLRNGTHGRLRVLIVTDSYHVFRSELVARRYFDEAYGVGTVGAFTTRSRGALREVWAVIDYAVRGRL